MPATKQGTVRVACPRCGHPQVEPASGYSTNCRQCGQYFRVQDELKPARRVVEPGPRQRTLTCFDCGRLLSVPASAQSSMCKHCGSYLDLRDYSITQAISKNFKTAGAFVVEPKGYIFNTECRVGEAVIKGRFLGRLVVAGTLTIHSSAELKGTFTAGCLVIPLDHHFRWREPIQVRSARIAGELVGNLHAEDTVCLESTARMFGDIASARLVIQTGAVVVGRMQIVQRHSAPEIPQEQPQIRQAG